MAQLRETALNFGPGGALVGVLSRPDASVPLRHPELAVVLLNAGVLHRVGPNRLHVRIARLLAENGVPAVRIDLPGIGDSGGITGHDSLIEEAMAGLGAAFDLLAKNGVARRFVVFGLCSGADHAFVAACTDPRVVGIALVDPNRVYSTWKAKALRLRGWASRPEVWFRLLSGRYRLLSQLMRRKRPQETGVMPLEEERRRVAVKLGELVSRRVRICYMVTGERRAYIYRNQLFDAFREVDLEPLTHVEIFRRANHTFTHEADKVRLEQTLARWVAEAEFAWPCTPAGTSEGDTALPSSLATPSRAAQGALVLIASGAVSLSLDAGELLALVPTLASWPPIRLSCRR